MLAVRRFVIVLGVAAAFLAATAFAIDANAPAKPKKPAVVKLEGTVSVTKDPNNVVTAVKLTTADKTVYNVTLDKKGLELGGLNDKKVETHCMVSEKDGKKWIMVHDFKPVEKKETPLAKPKGNKK